MTNPDPHPIEQWCGQEATIPAGQGMAAAVADRQVQVISPREVPLGGPRAMRVRRTLPSRERTLIGAWCFADHYGPHQVAAAAGMDVPPHPHTGLQTASWLFTGTVEHRDSAGVHELVRPGELNLMTGGYGIAHSEVSTPDTTVLHGVQLWVALPDAHRHTARGFAHHAPDPVELPGAVLRVFLGAIGGVSSPVPTFTELSGAEVVLAAGAEVEIEVPNHHEHGLLVDIGPIQLGGTLLRPGELGFLAAGPGSLRLANPTGRSARALILGGEPFDEMIIMWWNFVARSHEEIITFRRAWQEGSDRFGTVAGYTGATPRLPAPALPNARIKPRGNPANP